MKIIAQGNVLTADLEQLTAGSVGKKIKVFLSQEWKDLSVTAVFFSRNATIDVLVEADEITLPWELLSIAGHKVFVNLHGALPDGTVIIQTNIVSLGIVLPSRVPAGIEPQSPSPSRADQIQTLAENALALAISLQEEIEEIIEGGGGGGSALIFDTVPTEGSTNPVTSGGIRTAIDSHYVSAGRLSDSATGEQSTAEGDGNIASNAFSHAEGSGNTASGFAAHAEGQQSTASGMLSHAEGMQNTASGTYSHAEGVRTAAAGSRSHAEGWNTIAGGTDQHVGGRFNISDTGSLYAEIIGNGTADNARSNARTLDWNGNEVLTGKLTLGAAPTANMDAATKQYVDNAIIGAMEASY